MKKLVALILAAMMVAMCCGTAFAAEAVEAEWVDGESFLMANMDITIDTWMESEETRALALGCVVVEILKSYGNEPFSTFFKSGTITSYIGWADLTEGPTIVACFENKDSGEVWVCLLTLDDGVMSVRYDLSSDGEGMMKSLSEEYLEDGYYVCEEADLLEGMQAISEAISSED